jgi:hypothetical protein
MLARFYVHVLTQARRMLRRKLLAPAVVVMLLAIAATASASKCQDCVPTNEPSGGTTGTNVLTTLAPHYVWWEDFPSLPAGDRITLHSSLPDGVSNQQIKFVLRRAPGVWWKELRVFDRFNRPGRSMEFGGSIGSALKVDLVAEEASSIVLSKAGFLGFPVATYQLGDLDNWRGYQVTLTWEKD